jgi:chromosome segregation ATPase
MNEQLRDPRGKFQKVVRRLAEAAMSVSNHDSAEYEIGYIHEVQSMERKFAAILRGKMKTEAELAELRQKLEDAAAWRGYALGYNDKPEDCETRIDRYSKQISNLHLNLETVTEARDEATETLQQERHVFSKNVRLLNDRATAAEQKLEAAERALADIVNPLAAMKRRAEAEGARLSGMAYQIANDPNHLKEIARSALTPSAGGER